APLLSETEADRRVRGFLRGLPGTREAELVPLAGDASTRRYYRLRRAGGNSVLSVYPEPLDAEQHPFLVVRQLMAGWGLPVPEGLEVDGPRGVLLLEDLGDETLQERMGRVSEEARDELYRQALDQLVLLQRESVRGPQRAVCFQIAFDYEKLAWEMHFFWK